MPVVEDETGQRVYNPNQPTPPAPPAPPPPGMPPNPLTIDKGAPRIPTSPPGAPQAALNPLKGRQRFEAEINAKGFPSYWGHLFNMYVLSLQEDPNDPEYNKVLQWAKNNAKRHEAELSGKPLGSQKAKGPFVVPGEVVLGDPVKAPMPPGAPTILPPVKRPLGPKIVSEQEQERAGLEGEKASGKAWVKRQDERAEYAGNPVFRGAPVKTTDIMETGDEYLDQYLSDNGIVLEPGQRHRALETGEYVYMGQEHNETLNISRDSYFHVSDAVAAAADPRVLPPEVIAKYQEGLGSQVTGFMDPYLIGIWKQAVAYAADVAKAGYKVSPREIFDLWMTSAIEQKRKEGGGGGGGAGGQRLESYDYYRSMMQILGDISGVGGE